MKNLPVLVLVLSILFMFSPDKELFGIASIILLFFAQYAWRDNEPKIIFLGMLFYWLTVCALLVYGAIFNKPLIEQTLSPKTFIYTTYLAMIATFVYCSGILLAVRKLKISKLKVIFNELKQYDPVKLLLFYAVYSFSTTLLGATVLNWGGLSQVGVGLIWLKWAFLTILIMHTLLFPTNQKYVYIVLGIEVMLSFTGLFSAFKDYLLIAGAAFLSFSFVMNTRRMIFVFFLGIASFFLMVIWTVVKGDFRTYLTGGERTFVVEEVDKTKNLKKLSTLVEENFNAQNIEDNFAYGVEGLAHRINYTEYFAMSVAQVPAFIPYEHGALLMAGFEHVFKPRLFFPDKETIDDSQLTSKYTGRDFSGEEQGASFSLGLVAERYIDYGPYLMFFPIFGFGFLIGFIYKYIYTHCLNTVWGLACVAPLLFLIPSLGVATTKFLGWVLTYFIVWILFNKFFLKSLDTYLKYSKVSKVNDQRN